MPNTPWKEIIGMRNWLVGGYDRIRALTVWETATVNLPALIDEILQFLSPGRT